MPAYLHATCFTLMNLWKKGQTVARSKPCSLRYFTKSNPYMLECLFWLVAFF